MILLPLVLAALTAGTAPPLRWGADPQGGAPYIFPDPRDPTRLIGFEVDLVDELARRMGRQAVPVAGAWDKLPELLARGDFDIAVNGLEAGPDKERVARMSAPYFVAPLRMTVRVDDAAAPTGLSDVRGRPVGTLPGSVAERVLRDAGADVRLYEGGQDDIYEDLRLGRTAAALMDAPVARFYADVSAPLRTLATPMGMVRYAVMIPLDNAALHAEVDRALAQLVADGTLVRIYRRWGIYNEETAALLGGPAPVPREIAENFEAWRSAVGTVPPLWERITSRYPAMLPVLFRGAALTLALSLLAMLLAVVLGSLLALAQWKGPRAIGLLAMGYVEFFRGTPLLVQLLLVYFGLPELGVKLEPFTAGVLALGLNYAAAEAENQRAGLQSVPPGQLDAAHVLGLSPVQALRWVVLPQALRVSLPPMTNDFIALLKDSALVSVVTLTELTRSYANLANATRDHLGLGILVAVLYLLMGLPASRASRWLERRLHNAGPRA